MQAAASCGLSADCRNFRLVLSDTGGGQFAWTRAMFNSETQAKTVTTKALLRRFQARHGVADTPGLD